MEGGPLDYTLLRPVIGGLETPPGPNAAAFYGPGPTPIGLGGPGIFLLV